jgi:hypothetical protein
VQDLGFGFDKDSLEAGSYFWSKFTNSNFNSLKWSDLLVSYSLLFDMMINIKWFTMAFHQYCNGLLKW